MYRLHLLHLLRFPSILRRRARRSRAFTMLLLLSLILILLAPLYIIYKPPPFLIRYFQRRWPSVLWQVSTSSKLIALTIDDAPSDYTPEIMRLLDANEATATFFVIGSQAAGRESMLRDLVRHGHELGNHGMHDEPAFRLSDAALTEQIQFVEEVIRSAYTAVRAPAPPKYFRPGSGVFSARMRAILERLDYRLVLGSVYPHDAQVPFWRVNARHVLSMVRPGGIVICHDRRSWTVPMLGKVLPEMRRRGWRVVTVSQLVKETGPEGG